MRSGQVLTIGIAAATALFGAGVWYSQTRAWYVQVENPQVVAMRFDGESEPLLVRDFEGDRRGHLTLALQGLLCNRCVAAYLYRDLFAL